MTVTVEYYRKILCPRHAFCSGQAHICFYIPPACPQPVSPYLHLTSRFARALHPLRQSFRNDGNLTVSLSSWVHPSMWSSSRRGQFILAFRGEERSRQGEISEGGYYQDHTLLSLAFMGEDIHPKMGKESHPTVKP